MSLIFNVYIVNYLYFTEMNLLLVQYARLVKFKRLFWGFIGRILVWLGSTWFILYSICLKSFFVNLTFNGKCTWTKTLNMHYFVRTLMCRNKKISWKIHRSHLSYFVFDTPVQHWGHLFGVIILSDHDRLDI